MESTAPLSTEVILEEGFIRIKASGYYSLQNANHLFKLSIDSAVLHGKRNILIDVINIQGNIPFFDRFQFAEFLANYKAEHALTEVDRIAVVGEEPIVHSNRFGETVAVNRGVNLRVFTDMNQALGWLNLK
jgi:hypothetical protein